MSTRDNDLSSKGAGAFGTTGETMTKRQLAYSKKEAAAVTSLSLRGIDYLIERGQLRAVKVGRRVIIPAQELEKLVFNGARSLDQEKRTPA
jgi:excisionase family DNA binding protein